MLRKKITQARILHMSIAQRPRTSPRNIFHDIVKDYYRAIAAFALSDPALPYLSHKLQSEQMITIDAFRIILNSKKGNANCIRNLRELLVAELNDTEEMKAFKKAFQYICEIFMKYYSVNWIFHNKIKDKAQHLYYRCRILRRIQNPILLT